MKKCHGEQLHKLLTINPLKREFYIHIIKSNKDNNRKCLIIKHILEDFVNSLFEIFTKQDQNAFPYIIEVTNNKISLYYNIGNNLNNEKVFSFEIKTQKDIQEVVSCIWKYATGKNHESTIRISKIPDFSTNLIWSVWQNYYTELNDNLCLFYANYLYSDPNEGILEIDFLNFLFDVYNNLCQSIIKGEYLIYDNFSSEFLEGNISYEDIKKEHKAIIDRNSKSFTKTNTEPGIDILSTFSDNPYQDKNYIFPRTFDDNTLLDLASSFIDSDQLPYAYYSNINHILDYYRRFIVNIQKYTDIDKLHHFFVLEEQTMSNYEIASELCINGSLYEKIPAFCEMMQYVFYYVFGMCTIDHNFIATDANLAILLRTHHLLQPSDNHNNTSNYSLPAILSNFKNLYDSGQLCFNVNSLTKLQDSIKLLQIKNDILFLKMRRRAGYPITELIYHETSSKITKQLDNKENRNIFSVDFRDILPNVKNNFIQLNFLALQNKVITNIKKLKPYEILFSKIIYSEDSDYEKRYEELSNHIYIQANAIPKSSSFGIYSYNQILKYNFINHFKKYGLYIKKLKLIIQDKRNDDYLEELITMIDSNTENEIISCSFILKHLEWLHKVMSTFEKEQQKESHDFSLRFRYLQLYDILLQQLNLLIEDIEADKYCMNYGSFFQDCFFKLNEQQNLERCQTMQDEEFSFQLIQNSENIIFISSTWQPAISLVYLKKLYKKFNKEYRHHLSAYYSYYFNENTNQIKVIKETNTKMNQTMQNNTDNMHKLLADNKKETIQILGIFASFLAIATIGLGKVAQDGNGSDGDWCKQIFSICACLGYFVLLLQLIFFVKDKQYKILCYILIISISIITILLIFYCL